MEHDRFILSHPSPLGGGGAGGGGQRRDRCSYDMRRNLMTILRVGLVQLNSQHDVAANMAAIERLVGDAAARGARFVMLPEYAPYLGPDAGYLASAEPIPGPLTERFAALARRHDIYL